VFSLFNVDVKQIQYQDTSLGVDVPCSTHVPVPDAVNAHEEMQPWRCVTRGIRLYVCMLVLQVLRMSTSTFSLPFAPSSRPPKDRSSAYSIYVRVEASGVVPAVSRLMIG
jgi:hypothetical protein